MSSQVILYCDGTAKATRRVTETPRPNNPHCINCDRRESQSGGKCCFGDKNCSNGMASMIEFCAVFETRRDIQLIMRKIKSEALQKRFVECLVKELGIQI